MRLNFASTHPSIFLQCNRSPCNSSPALLESALASKASLALKDRPLKMIDGSGGFLSKLFARPTPH